MLTSLKTSPSPCNYNYPQCLSRWCTQTQRHTHTHTPTCLLLSDLQHTSGLDCRLPVSQETWSIICFAVSPFLPHPSALKDICEELLSPFDKAAVMSEAQSPWARWLITGGALQPHAYPYAVSPTALFHFTFLPLIPIGAHQCSNWLPGFASLHGKSRGGWWTTKTTTTTTTIWRWGPEHESWGEWKRSRAPPVTSLTSCRASQQSLSLISGQETQSLPETF